MKWKKLGHLLAAAGQSEWLHSHGTVPIARAIGDFHYRIYFSPRDRRHSPTDRGPARF
jgi:hypothetical protein